MLDALIWLSSLAALAGAMAGNRTAWPLLASLLLCTALDHLRVGFNPFFWMMVDFGVVLAIISPRIRWRDCIVMALFLPAWVLYQMGDPLRHVGTSLIVAAQLLLTFPIYRAAALVRLSWSRITRRKDTMEMRLA